MLLSLECKPLFSSSTISELLLGLADHAEAGVGANHQYGLCDLVRSHSHKKHTPRPSILSKATPQSLAQEVRQLGTSDWARMHMARGTCSATVSADLLPNTFENLVRKPRVVYGAGERERPNQRGSLKDGFLP